MTQLSQGQRRKTRVVPGGGHSIGFEVGEQRAVRLQRTNAATQLPVLGQGNKTCPRFLQPKSIFGRGAWVTQRRRDGGARNWQQYCTGVSGLSGHHGVLEVLGKENANAA